MKSQIVEGMMRSNNCGELDNTKIGTQVTLTGWVNKSRNLGGLYFIDLRDKYGITQLNLTNYSDEESLKKCHLESTILIKGIVQLRPSDAINKNMVTGEVEVAVETLEVLSESDINNLPFLPSAKIEATDDLKFKYRYLDLRTSKLQSMLKKRSDLNQVIRRVMIGQGFIEVETPILYKSTPEGARDYVVPSRVHKGKVYALPQSPQTLKQLLMIGGTDKYFQICRCFRDEDLRSDRQPEFTQLDVEASFITAKYSKKMVEEILKNVFNFADDFSLQVMSYNDAMNEYGCDKPDLRFALKHLNVTDLFKGNEFKVFSEPANNNGLIKAIFLSNDTGTLSRKELDSFSTIVKPYGGKGVAFFKVENGKCSGGVSKFINDETLNSLEKILKDSKDSNTKNNNGIWLFCADLDHEVAHASADVLRRKLGDIFNLRSDKNEFLWVNDFPLLEWKESEKRFFAKHHPFTMPRADWIERFLKGDTEDLKECIADAYDLVCNGYEVAGGSMRIFRNDIQNQMFKVLNFSEEEAKSQFGFFLEALKYGVPPHGGFAFGLDRLMMIIEKTEFIKDVIAFPKTNSATDLMSNAPSIPAKEQTDELSFKWL